MSMVTGFAVLSRLTQIAPPHTRFVFLGAGIRLGLPSHPASRRRSCLRLGVSTTSSSRGLSPPSDRPCRAYSSAAPLRGTAPALPAPRSALRAVRAGAPPSPQAPSDQAHSQVTLPMATGTFILAPDCPARGHRINHGPAGRRMRSATPPIDPMPAPTDSAPATMTARTRTTSVPAGVLSPDRSRRDGRQPTTASRGVRRPAT
jgi:hypothetical protein